MKKLISLLLAALVLELQNSAASLLQTVICPSARVPGEPRQLAKVSNSVQAGRQTVCGVSDNACVGPEQPSSEHRHTEIEPLLTTLPLIWLQPPGREPFPLEHTQFCELPCQSRIRARTTSDHCHIVAVYHVCVCIASAQHGADCLDVTCIECQFLFGVL
eukprot:781845-Amphidinium_carterae.2